MGKYDGEVVMFFGCMERLENEMVQAEMKQIEAEGGTVIEVRNPGGTVTPAMLEEIRRIVKERKVDEFRFRPHTACGAKNVAFNTLNGTLKVSPEVKREVVEPYENLKGTRTLDLFEEESANMDYTLLQRMLTDMGVRCSMKLYDIKPIKEELARKEEHHESVVLVTTDIDATPEQIADAAKVGIDGGYTLVATKPELLDVGVEVAVLNIGAKDVRVVDTGKAGGAADREVERLSQKPFMQGIGLTEKKAKGRAKLKS